jgi:hypothetical protein
MYLSLNFLAFNARMDRMLFTPYTTNRTFPHNDDMARPVLRIFPIIE